MVCLAAVKSDGAALQFVDPLLTDDERLVVAAVESNGRAFRYSSERLRGKMEIVLAACNDTVPKVEWKKEIWKFATEELKNKEKFPFNSSNQKR